MRNHLMCTRLLSGYINTKKEILCMREAGKLASQALQLALDLTHPGQTGNFIEKQVHKFIVQRKGYPSARGYMGFPKSLLISINDVCCHGIPNDKRFEIGDIIKYDCLVYLNGHHGDCAATIAVQEALSPTHTRLIQSCKEARNAAISLCRPGIPISAIGDCISKISKRDSFPVARFLCGHFIGKEIHMLPIIPHIPNACHDLLQEGQTLTIGTDLCSAKQELHSKFLEPIFMEGSEKLYLMEDGFSIATQDKKVGVHWEHTILITKNEPEILTLLKNEL